MAITLNGSTGVTTNSGAVYDGLQTGTAVSASGTSVDFTGIPSWVKRITVMFAGVSTNGASNYIVQLGDSGGIEVSGYLGAYGNTAASASGTTGFGIYSGGSGVVFHGSMFISNITENSWIASHSMGRSDNPSLSSGGGSKSLSATLDRIRITTVNGTDTFDAGTINIIYE